MNLFLLYLEFFKIGIFAVGGGLATLPFLFLMAHDRYSFIRQSGWLSTEQVGNFLAIAQCSPGAIGVNVTAQTGFQYGGIAGGILAVLGLISPAFIVIAIVTRALQSLKENKIATSVFSGLRPAATGLLCAAGWGVWRLVLFNGDGAAWRECIRWRDGLVCAAIYLLIVKFRGHPVIYVAVGAAAGMLLRL
ncbi:MAG: chromate transporter [Treponema sp.]|jgi:chromate transporter|nr:chromate transporter [Treponema sp.]